MSRLTPLAKKYLPLILAAGGGALACSESALEPRPLPIRHPATGGSLGVEPLAAGGSPVAGSGGANPTDSAGGAQTGGGNIGSGDGLGSGGAASGGSGGSYGYSYASGGEPSYEPGLLGAPMVVVPTRSSFGVNAVYLGGPPDDLSLRYKALRSIEPYAEAEAPELVSEDTVQWHIGGLTPGTNYLFEILDTANSPPDILFSGQAVTQREPGSSYDFVLITDTHIQPREVYPGYDALNYYEEFVLWEVVPQMMVLQPDFIVNLGDILDFHLFGFNVAPPSPDYTRQAYLNYRRLMGTSLGRAAHFPVIGNWDGENGDFAQKTIDESRAVRAAYAPSPKPDTYPEGGSPHGDYYAYTWGDALFVVLNVMTYTPTSHLLSYYGGAADDWTLGTEQLAWLEQTLAQATSTFRFLLIHHTVGGKAGTDADSAYGRGGGQAAAVGEQAVVHQFMKQYGVQIFFYGHDHVFTDMVVDNIHYTLPGSAGAPWKFTQYETGYETYWLDSGHARVHVDPDRVQVDFISISGAILHSYEVLEN